MKVSRQKAVHLFRSGKIKQVGVIVHGGGINAEAFAEDARSRGLITAEFRWSGQTRIYWWTPGNAPKQ